ncbi:Protein DENND6B [Bagarius yarrelli]|uniref:Protein DENND6B n=1 Tax=Bagarius yarrelli TaxID=175774 RepID=A0A556TI90_BAGYA|nr:Protein DENND6B [Bagarius yarrelli]
MDRFDSQKKSIESKVPEALISGLWARFSAWLECVCVVTFDLELGQAIELIFPHEAKLTEKEKTSICYLSFPDSFSGCLGDTQFSFRLRQSVGRASGLWFGDKDVYNREAPPTLQKEMAHFYGYVYFRQVKDASIKRGYFQKSLVLVSRLPYIRLFQSLLQIIAPEYFEKAEPCLEAVCNEIDQWPPPAPGQTLSLPMMGVILQVKIPSKDDKPGGSPSKQAQKEKQLSSPMVPPTVHELELFKCFQSVLIHVQLLWELILLGEPLVVMAPSPAMSSEMVLSLVSCISPLKYCCDFRPYFTIHDSEFKEYTTRTQAPPNVLLGVTNPFFIKTFQSWPHIMCLGDLQMSRTIPGQPDAVTNIHHSLESHSPWTPPQIRPFSQDEFLASLDHAGPPITSTHKGDWLGLYKQFFKSANFDGWFRAKHREMTQKVECLHLEVICDADLLSWTKDKSEVETVDLILKLREKLMKAHMHQLPVREELLHKMENSIHSMIISLPEDLQTVLHKD